MVVTGVKTIFMIIRNIYMGTITFPETRKTHLPRYINLSGNQKNPSTPVHQPFQKPGRHIYPGTSTFSETWKTHLSQYINLSRNLESTSTPVHQPFQKPGRHIYPKTLRSPFSSLRNKHQFLSHAKTQRGAKMKKSIYNSRN